MMPNSNAILSPLPAAIAAVISSAEYAKFIAPLTNNKNAMSVKPDGGF
jgi:hypothetical protein